jgi:IclR family transcriptional regulator, KDG regulon repressor
LEWGTVTEQSMQTISRAVNILKAFSQKEKELSLAELHRKLGLSKSSLQRILNTLVLQGLIDKDENRKTYRLGIELYFLGHLVEENSNLMSIAKPYMKHLNERFDETISLSIIHHNKRKCIGYIASNHELAALTYIGQYSPLYAGSSAKCLMAYLPDDEVEELLDGEDFETFTTKTIKNKEKLLDELHSIRENGFSISYGERVPGTFSISAPIIDRFNRVIAAISILMPTVRVEETQIEEYIEQVKETAKLISMKLS